MKHLHWVIQQDLWNETGYRQILDALAARNIPHDIVKVKPFIHTFVPEISPTGPTIVMGWEGFGVRAKSLGWSPGAYLSENLDQRIWLRTWGDHCLNADSSLGRLGDVPVDGGELFIRPVLDDKSFAGRLDSPKSLIKWKEDLAKLVKSMHPGEEIPTVTLDTIVSWASPKLITEEWRLFVVGGKVITGSRYQLHGRSTKGRMFDPATYDSRDGQALASSPWAFAQRCVDEWRPTDNFVIDIAQTPNGLKIVECGCLNAAGWYDSDVSAIVDAIEDYERSLWLNSDTADTGSGHKE